MSKKEWKREIKRSKTEITRKGGGEGNDFKGHLWRIRIFSKGGVGSKYIYMSGMLLYERVFPSVTNSQTHSLTFFFTLYLE